MSEKSKKLLLADDSVTIQRVIQLTFADEDIDVIAVSDGREAIERLDRDPPDIVLADVGMPQHDGYEVASYVKSNAHLAHIPVILLSGAFDPIDEARAKAVGCDGVLAKPFEPQQVIARVRQLLASGKGASNGPFVPPAEAPAGAERDVLDGFTFQAPTAATPNAPPVPGSLDDYFDRLDNDLTSASAAVPARPAPPQAPRPPAPDAADIDWLPQTAKPLMPQAPKPAGDWSALAPAVPAPAAASIPGDWFPAPQADPSGEPSRFEAPTELIERPAPATFAGPPPEGAGGAVSIADAFAALLAAEQGAPPPPPQFDVPPLSDEMIDLIVSRVLERMTGETVSEIVTRVAERLVREEIERITKNLGSTIWRSTI